MNENKKNKVRMFINDFEMSEVIYEELLKVFLKKKTYTSIEEAGGYRLATDLLQDAWRELRKYRLEIGEEELENPTPHV